MIENLRTEILKSKNSKEKYANIFNSTMLFMMAMKHRRFRIQK